MPAPIPGTLLAAYAFPEPVQVTQPVLPSLSAYASALEPVWARRWLTNNGAAHQELERRLRDYLAVEHCSLLCNGTVALLVALHALDLGGGEIITTPFTFPATVHALHWSGVQPVFCDIDEATYNLDPTRIEAQITSATQAILAVHVYGTPCDVEAIQSVADAHGLPVIYDAAHAMGVRHRGRALADYGALSILSFHATKLFTTGEGGAIIAHSSEMERRIYYLKNFGISGEESVEFPGINGKMCELQATLGLLGLELVHAEIAARKALTVRYRSNLGDIHGLTLLADAPETEPNYAYFPVRIDPERFGLTRAEVNAALRAINIFPRKYFFPLCSHGESYRAHPSAAAQNLPIAERAAQQVLCLPLHGGLAIQDIDQICGAVLALHRHGQRA